MSQNICIICASYKHAFCNTQTYMCNRCQNKVVTDIKPNRASNI